MRGLGPRIQTPLPRSLDGRVNPRIKSGDGHDAATSRSISAAAEM
jgi:hypothetical protein